MVSMFEPPLVQAFVCQPTFRELPYSMKRHWATRIHDDLRLQWNGVLLSWALNGKPIFRVGESRPATEMEDHDRDNILFEGVHRTGTIMVWDCGSWEPLTDGEDVLDCLERGFLRFALRGGKLRGVWTLTLVSRAAGGRPAEWTLFKEAELPGEPAIFECALEVQPISICSQMTKEEIERDWFGGKEAQPMLFN